MIRMYLLVNEIDRINGHDCTINVCDVQYLVKMLDCRNSDQPLPNDASHPQIQPSLVIEAEPFEIEMKALASNNVLRSYTWF